MAIGKLKLKLKFEINNIMALRNKFKLKKKNSIRASADVGVDKKVEINILT